MNLNAAQRAILLAGILLFVGMGVYPLGSTR